MRAQHTTLVTSCLNSHMLSHLWHILHTSEDICQLHLSALTVVVKVLFIILSLKYINNARNIDTYSENLLLNLTTPANVRCNCTGFSKNVPEILLPLCGASELVLIMTKSKYFDCKYCIWKRKLKIQISLKQTIFSSSLYLWTKLKQNFSVAAKYIYILNFK